MRSGRVRSVAALAFGWTAALAVARAEPLSSADCRATASPTVLMVLSPRMVYALREWPRMQRTAERAGFAVCSLRDPRVGESEWRAAANAAGRSEALDLPLLDTAMLRASAIPGLLNHSPASLVQFDGRLHPWPILGVMPDAAWIAVLQDRLDRLRASR